jgi:hypothetical protein
MIVEWEDGSALEIRGDCVSAVRDAETGQWSAADPGRTYYGAADANRDGLRDPIVGCPPSLPDTAANLPSLDGLIVIGALLVAAAIGRKVNR